MADRDATRRIAGARRGIRVSELSGPHGELYMTAVDSQGRVRLVVHVHDPADEHLVAGLLEIYLATRDRPSSQLRLI